ncbi:MAG: hypothetical protein GY874_02680 [Desulfobacteraceae bacterium]|nr:hypothetical protein [Desulfobacteraceae bacterium]
MEYKLSQESAQQQFALFTQYYELDPEHLPEEQEAAFNTAVGKILRAVRLGRVEIASEDGIKVRQHLRNPMGETSTIDYAELSGKAKIAMKSKKDTDYYGRMYALLGSLSGLGETAVTGLKSVDLSLAECLGVLFLQI